MSVRLQQFTPRQRRHRRIRRRVAGTASRPRLAVFRSLTSISAQLIDDTRHQTLLALTDRDMAAKGTAQKPPKTERARALGEQLAAKAQAAKITTVVFDRGGYRYHGRVKALAEGARAQGLVF